MFPCDCSYVILYLTNSHEKNSHEKIAMKRLLYKVISICVMKSLIKTVITPIVLDILRDLLLIWVCHFRLSFIVKLRK